MAKRPSGGKRALSAQELALVDILIERATESGLAPSQIVEFPGDVVDAVTDAVTSAADAVGDAADAVTQAVADAGEAVADAVTDAVTDAGEAIADAVTDFVDAVGGSEIGDEATVAALVSAVKAVATMKSPTLQQLLDIRAASQRAGKGR